MQVKRKVSGIVFAFAPGEYHLYDYQFFYRNLRVKNFCAE